MKKIGDDERRSHQRTKSKMGDIMLSSNANDDEGSQLVLEEKGNLATPLKPKNIFKMMDADAIEGSSKKKLLDESDFENDLHKGNIPVVKRQKFEDLFSYGDKDAEDLLPTDSVATLDTIDAFVGPVKT